MWKIVRTCFCVLRMHIYRLVFNGYTVPKREKSPYLQILFPVKRCGKSGGNGYEPANGFPNAAALRGREEMVQEK